MWDAADSRLRDRERKREVVILTAARAFRERGYHNTSLDDIARDLNVTKPTVYHYVANKEELLFECFRTGLSLIMQGLEEVGSSTASARERLEVVIKHYVDAITSDFGWCMVQAENQDLSPTMSRKVKALKSEIDHGIRQLIRDGLQDGSIRECDPKMSAFALAGALNWITYWYRSDDSLSATEIAERFIDLFDFGLRPRRER
jgi:AcrR family transcriptional regulator